MVDVKRVRRTADVAEAAALLDTAIEEVVRGGTRLVLQRHGRDVVALVSAYDLERLEALDRRADEGFRAIQEIQARFSHLDPEEVERDILEEVEAMRADDRAKRAKRSASPATPRT